MPTLANPQSAIRNPQSRPRPVLHVARRYVAALRRQRFRTMRQFAEQEIIIPDGEYAGRPFDVEIQPFTGLWLDAVDSGLWRRFWSTGPVQSGKTLLCVIVPTLYHLFERLENVVFGVPTLTVSNDKWESDLLPAIRRSRYAVELPIRGPGSKGGRVYDVVRFRNGRKLYFVGGGGRDSQRAGVTAPVAVITEADKLDERSSTSEETDKLSQIEARTSASDVKARLYAECTVTTATAATWREITAGTNSRIETPCPHCERYVKLEREHLLGWSDQPSERLARVAARFRCPNCQADWTERDRLRANRRAVLVHEGQTITAAGEIVGVPRDSETFGFRWSGVNNLFVSPGTIGVKEWRQARRKTDAGERELRQYIWALPHEPADRPVVALDDHALRRRTGTWPQGTVPAQTEFLTAGVDIRKQYLHWVVSAWWGGATGTVVDYQVHAVRSDDLGPELAVLQALREFRDLCLVGWTSEAGGLVIPDRVVIDSGYLTDIVYEFIDSSRALVAADGLERFCAIKGAGASQYKGKVYSRPTRRTRRIHTIGEAYHIVRLDNGVDLVHADVDYWKSWVHERFAAPAGQAGAVSLFARTPEAHTAFVKHLTAEVQINKEVPGYGYVQTWDRRRDQNHWLDATVYAAIGGHLAGVRLLDPADDDAENADTPKTDYFANQTRKGRRRG